MEALDPREVPLEGRDRIGHIEQTHRPIVASPLVVDPASTENRIGNR